MKKIQILIVMVLMLVNQALTANNEPKRATAMYAEGTVLNVWAVNGLNMREGPGKDFPIARKLEYGDEVKVIDPFIGDFPMSVKVLDKKGKDQDLELMGNWVRVMLDDVEGYVFDGYLSRLPVIRLNGFSTNENGRSVCEAEYIETYLKRKFELESDSLEDGSDNFKEMYFEDGVYFYTGGNEGCGWDGLELKDMTLNEGFLLLNLMHQVDAKVEGKEYEYKIEKGDDGSIKIILMDEMSQIILESDENGVTIHSEGCC